MGAGLSGEALLVVVLLGLGFYIGEQVWDGAKVVGHKTKCGVMRVVGKHCDAQKPPAAGPDDPDPVARPVLETRD